MFKRHIKPLLAKALSRSPVVLLNGARQVGKTTLALEFLKENHYNYITFDDEITYLAAKGDVQGFVNNINKPVILDEVQRVPEIFLAIKQDVDKNRLPGRYLLTGSANPLLIPRLGDSLAGRMEIIDLMPLSQGEIHGINDRFIDTIFGDHQLKTPKQVLSKSDLYKSIITGGYPSVQNSDIEDREAWLRNYLNLILQRDIKDLANIEKLTEIPNLLKILASRVSNILNYADVARDSKMNIKTVHRYSALLETIFMISLLPAWHTNLTLRVTKSPKLCLVDSGLLAYLLNISAETAFQENIVMGRIIENFVVGELRKQATWCTTKVGMYHFRTTSGEEVDIVLEDRAGQIIGIEVKSSSTVVPEDFKGLKYLREKVGDKLLKGFVLYTGNLYVPFGQDLHALPIHALWHN